MGDVVASLAVTFSIHTSKYCLDLQTSFDIFHVQVPNYRWYLKYIICKFHEAFMKYQYYLNIRS